MPYKRILTIQDISCVGQCSMSVAHPILSACGHEVCMLPTAVLSTHTGGFGKPVVCDLSGSMADMAEHWRNNGITFDVICIGYLGSLRAAEQAEEIMASMLAPNGITIVDPAMADHGKRYSGLDAAYAAVMQRLCEKADVMIPNVTEAAMMTGQPYRAGTDREYLTELLSRLGGKTVVLTGAETGPGKTGAAVRQKGEITFCTHDKLGGSFHGTGDMFAAAFAGAMASGKDAVRAAEIAGLFTARCIENTLENPAHWYGVKFETVLCDLVDMLK